MNAPPITTSIETITPEIAAEMLQHNTRNRHVRPGRVLLYADAMAQGCWTVTGESIAFDSAGQLVNGQHRLMACVKSNHPFTTLIVRNVVPTAFEHTDTGVARTNGDVLKRREIPKWNLTAAAARLVLYFEANTFGGDAAAIAASRDKILREVELNGEIYKNALNGCEKMRSIAMIESAGVAFLVLATTRGLNPDEWMHRLLDGVDLQSGDPRLALRSWLVNARRLPTPFYLGSTIHAFNASRRGESRKKINTWVKGTPFPTFDLP
jgi:hypothetical protein